MHEMVPHVPDGSMSGERTGNACCGLTGGERATTRHFGLPLALEQATKKAGGPKTTRPHI